MILPQKISDSIATDASLNATVSHAIDACKTIISTAPEFFPEYTDHGPDHNTEVLDTALAILTDDALDKMSNADFAALALSVLLHDCGMHLTGDTFVELISPKNTALTRLDTKAWKTLWDEFILEAKRFDGRHLRSLFGSSEPISEPPADPADFTRKHRLLIGEFLRQHHPRLAHEISIFGLPARNGARIKILREEAGDLAEVSGLIARSHGVSLREACDLFKEHFHEREYQSIHPPVVMAALRIADYLQVQPERAPKSALKLHKLRSPFSVGEWRVHQSVRNITPADEDPEAIYVDAQPETVETYLKFKYWAQSFQSELDATWAALGEVYGRFGDMDFDKFQLKLRRLRTSIDDEKRFSKSASYLPAKIAFEASSPDLLGLLVAPLYGNKPEVGLRELIQNSLDSVIERAHIEDGPPTEMLHGKHDTDVIVYPVFENDEIVSVIIEDRGIGMDANVVQNYFLRAGASFRSSPQWKKEFTSNSGESDVARTGRFGIGALAGFLLGSSIEVETRRLDSEEGLKFSAELDKEAIEVTKCTRNVGTKILIRIDAEKRKAVGSLFAGKGDGQNKWDWYCNTYPKLLRLDNKGDEIASRFVYSPDEKWVSVDVPNYSDVLWSLQPRTAARYPNSDRKALYGNGILICGLVNQNDTNKIVSETKISPDIGLSMPTVLVTDKNGHLPLNLQRDDISTTDKDLSDAMRHSMAQDLIAQAIAFAPDAEPFTQAGMKQLYSRKLSCSFARENWYYKRWRPQWCWEDHGWRLADPAIATKKPYLLVMHEDLDLSFLLKDKAMQADVSFAWESSAASPSNATDIKSFFRTFVKENLWNRAPLKSIGQLLPSQTVFSEKVFKKLKSSNPPKYLKDMLEKQTEHLGRQVALMQGAIEHPLLTKLKSEIEKSEPAPFAFTFLGGQNTTETKDRDILVTLWSELIGIDAIPPLYAARKAAFPEAYKALGSRIEYYRSVLEEKA